jgi:hypothetical protein
MKRLDYLQDFKLAGQVARTTCIQVKEHAWDPK